METPIYTKHVGEKFYEDGAVRTFPGNTVICRIGASDRIYSELIKARDLLSRMPTADKYVFMPPSSYHMTVFDGVCDQVRKPDRWTRYVPLAAPLGQVDKLFIERYRSIRTPESFTMMCNRISPTGVRLLPANEEERAKLRRFRDELSEKLGIRHPNHDVYEFHITLAYNIKQLTEAEKTATNEYAVEISRQVKGSLGVFRVSAPELVFFEDMFAFHPKRER